MIQHLNDLYTQLEYETDDKTIKQIKRQIKNIEKNMRCPYCTKLMTNQERRVFGMCKECYDNNVE